MILKLQSAGGERESGKDLSEFQAARNFPSRNRGQVLPLVAIGLAVLALALTVNFNLGKNVLERIQLQMVADRAAESAAWVLADSLNMLATTNLTMLSMGLSAFLGHGEAVYIIQELQYVQDLIIQTAGPAAIAKAEFVANEHGALAIPLNYLTGTALPSLMVARAYMSPIHVWHEDRLQTTPDKVAGERLVRLLERKAGPEPVGDHQRTTLFAVAEAAAQGERILGEQIFFPLPVPNYKAGLVEMKCNLPEILP